MSVRLAPWEAVTSELVAKPVSRRSAQVLSRFTAGDRPARFWIALWLAAAAAELGVFVPVIFAHGAPHPSYDIAFRLLGGSFAACGLLAWRRRPDSRSGLLMTAAGFGFFLSPLLSQLDASVAQTGAVFLTDIWTIPFIALLLTFVTGGRLQSATDVALVGVFVLSLVCLQFVWMLFLDEPRNLLAAFPSDAIANVVDKSQRTLTLVGCVATLVVIAARWRAAPPPR